MEHCPHRPERPGAYQITRLLGAGLSDRTLRPLIAYLYEWEKAAEVRCPGFSTARPDNCRFHLLH